jgi:hypothetical protein
MRWFRSNTGIIGWLAFFALACQLVLTFGHVHAAKGYGGAGWAAFAPAGNSTDNGPVSPPNPSGAADEFCAICANINLAGALVVPLLAAIVALISFVIILPEPEEETRPASIAYLPFNARGPPVA